MNSRTIPAVLLITMLLAGCNYQISSPARTEVPLFVPPAVNTPTPQPTPTPDYASFIQMGEEFIVAEDGYAFTPVLIARENGPSYQVQFYSDDAPLNNNTKRYLSISAGDSGLVFFNYRFQDESITDGANCIVSAIEREMTQGAEYPLPDSEDYVLPIGPAQRAALSGTIMGYHSTGELVVTFSESSCLAFFGASYNKFEDDVALWNNVGKLVFERMIASLRTLSPEELPKCQIAPNEAYGFSPDEPIAVGNTNLYDGREREELYLLTLRGPNNEEIFFARQRPMFNQNGEIVDPYLIGYGDTPERDTIYFTIYRFAEPLYAPHGYNCEAAFPLTQP